jgi:hypothetical protein
MLAAFLCVLMPCLAKADSLYPDHCADTGYPGLKSCPAPPLAVARRAIPDELTSCGVPAAPDAAKHPEAYAQWYESYFLTKRVVQPYGAFRIGESRFGIDTSKSAFKF